MADNNFKGTVEALFTGIDGVVSSKTVQSMNPSAAVFLLVNICSRKMITNG